MKNLANPTEAEFRKKQWELAELLLSCAERIDEETVIVDGTKLSIKYKGGDLVFRDDLDRLAGIVSLMVPLTSSYKADYTGRLTTVESKEAADSPFRETPTLSSEYNFYFYSGKWVIGTIPSKRIYIFGTPVNDNPLILMVKKYRNKYSTI